MIKYYWTVKENEWDYHHQKCIVRKVVQCVDSGISKVMMGPRVNGGALYQRTNILSYLFMTKFRRK